jgi:hypothetical protein
MKNTFILITISIVLLLIIMPRYREVKQKGKLFTEQTSNNIQNKQFQNIDPFYRDTPSEHLTEAKKALTEGRVDDAKEHLARIQRTSPEWKNEGQKLWEETLKKEKIISKKVEEETLKNTVKERKEFAKRYEIALLDKGIDTTVTTHGKYNTTLRIKWVLMSRPVVHQLTKDKNFISSVKRLGFKKIEFTDGYNDQWSVTFSE